MRVDPETLILRTLLDGEAYAQQIIDAIHERSAGELSICMGTIQPTLARMYDEGLLSRAERDPDDSEPHSGRRRMYYQLAEKGRVRTIRNEIVLLRLLS